jgi:hypothetical protein
VQVYSDIHVAFISEGVRHRFIFDTVLDVFLGKITDTVGSRAVRSFFVRGDVLGKDTYWWQHSF